MLNSWQIALASQRQMLDSCWLPRISTCVLFPLELKHNYPLVITDILILTALYTVNSLYLHRKYCKNIIVFYLPVKIYKNFITVLSSVTLDESILTKKIIVVTVKKFNMFNSTSSTCSHIYHNNYARLVTSHQCRR